MTLKNGGKITDIELKPLPSEFFNDWNNVYQKWILLKTIISNNIFKESQTGSSMVVKVATSETPVFPSLSSSSSELEVGKIIKIIKENGVIPLVNSSNVLVTKLGQYAKDSSQYSLYLQGLFAVLNIGVTTAFIFYIKKIIKANTCSY